MVAESVPGDAEFLGDGAGIDHFHHENGDLRFGGSEAVKVVSEGRIGGIVEVGIREYQEDSGTGFGSGAVEAVAGKAGEGDRNGALVRAGDTESDGLGVGGIDESVQGFGQDAFMGEGARLQDVVFGEELGAGIQKSAGVCVGEEDSGARVEDSDAEWQHIEQRG